ncbi:hypothetical protein AAG906_017760 [Vitis piasezkii]
MATSYSQRKYDVFLSFRGEDTRNNFTAHLYDALHCKGINAFIDADKLGIGEIISPALLSAIEGSRFSIVVLSENYGSSRWCLEELVKILECKKTKGQVVLPIFYQVDPSDVRKQKGSYGKAFAKHEENMKENMEKVHIWREALSEVGNISDWDSRNKDESVLIKEIVSMLLNKLLSTPWSDAEDQLVGIGSQIREMELLLCTESTDVRMVGIWGMGGIGKTTLAQAIYNRVSSQFEGCSYLEDVGEDLRKRGLIGLQEKLFSQYLGYENIKLNGPISLKARLCSLKVFIVLDNVYDQNILECLVGSHDWFGQGSRIIITTRDKRLLISHGVRVYEVKKLVHTEAVEFLRCYASKQQIAIDEYMELSKSIITYAQGLPLVLKVLGSFLFSMNKHEWRSELDKLKDTPHGRIQEVLRISYDGLDDKEKNIFLDIACFFRDGCSFFAVSGIRGLIDKSLITISNNDKIVMHDLLQEMGWKIIRLTSPKEPGKRSRLWIYEDAYHVLKVEGIFLNLSGIEEIHFTTKAFAGMDKLRLLKLYDYIPSTNSECTSKRKCKVHIPRDFKFHYDELRYLHLHGYPLKLLPHDFSPKNLVDLSLSCSYVKQLWKGIKVLENLKFMDLSHSKYLVETPNFSGISNLEKLALTGFTYLREVHPTLGVLGKLSFLSLRDCKMLKNIPNSIYETATSALPSSICLLRNLQVLSFNGCKGPPSASWLTLLPRKSLGSLKKLNLRDSNISEGADLSHLAILSSLENLDLSGNNFISLPSSISQLSHLVSLKLQNCGRLQALSELPSSIKEIDAHNCRSLETISNQSLFSSLRHVSFSECLKIKTYQTTLGPCCRLWQLFFKLRRESVTIEFSTIVPGSEIRDWFRYQSSGSEVNIELPPNWFNSNFLGFALSAVLGFDAMPSHDPNFNVFSLFCIFDFQNSASSYSDNVLHLNSGPALIDSFKWHEVNHFEAAFMTFTTLALVVKRCGIRLVYSSEDVSDNNPTMIQYIAPPPPPRSTLLVQEIDEGEASGSACSSEDSCT